MTWFAFGVCYFYGCLELAVAFFFGLLLVCRGVIGRLLDFVVLCFVVVLDVV